MLCIQFNIDCTLSIPFFPSFNRLLLYREPRTEEQLVGEASNKRNKSNLFCRVLILSFLESLTTKSVQSTILLGAVEHLATTLFYDNLSNRYHNAIVGSDLFGEQLRSWQALCILAPLLSEEALIPLIDVFLTDILCQTCSPGIRVHFEVFGSILFIRFPEIVLPQILSILRRQFNIAQQTLASFLVMLGHVIITDLPLLTPSAVLSIANKIEIAEVLMPWLVCGSSLPRSIAQLIMFVILPEILQHLEQDEQDIIRSETIKEKTNKISNLNGIFLFLSENKETVKMIHRQRAFFTSYQLEKLCTVHGLLNIIGADQISGEFVPEHLLTILAGYFKGAGSNPMIGIDEHPRSDEDNGDASSLSRDLQTKIVISWDELSLDKGEPNGHEKASRRTVRHPLIVCASLIEKPINLAGIARTSEIFAIRSLIIASKQVTKSEEFKGVAVSSSGWLPMDEVSEEKLPSYLQAMKSQGYTIIGIEQTGSSVCLSEVSFPAKSLFLLGREKEGIPVKLLQLMDLCVEIPQFGIIRSLNVHVSASIAIWEYCKQHI